MNSLYLSGRRALDYLDKLSDSLTTFRALLYILLIYLASTLLFALDGKYSFSASQILLSAATLVATAKISNLFFSKTFRVPINQESDIITGLILALILTPATTAGDYGILAAAAAVAMLSKYILSVNGRHIFNPAALGAVISGLVFSHYASWWVGTSFIAPILLVGGFLIVRKMRRFEMVLIFSLLSLVYKVAAMPSFELHGLYLDIVSTPLLFIGPIMLTEPLTSPTKRNNILIYSLVVSIFYSLPDLHRSPEEALLIGNLVAVLVEPNRSLLLKLVSKHEEALGIVSYIFRPNKPVPFLAGQYMEWTLPHVGLDRRGNRRYLTIASAPTEKDLMFTVKIPSPSSNFKKRLQNLNVGDNIVATRLAGDFVLPKDPAQKIAFIAGGVGITPFRSMIKDIADRQEQRDITLFYSVRSPEELAFKNLFSDAKKIGVSTKYVINSAPPSGKYLTGYLNGQMIADNMPDYTKRTLYISGPQAFVSTIRIQLIDLGVKPHQITTDFFPGYN